MNGWSNHSFWAIIVLKSAQSFFCLRLLACNHKQSNKPPILRTTMPKKCKLVQNLENRFLTLTKSAFCLRHGLSNSNSVQVKKKKRYLKFISKFQLAILFCNTWRYADIA